jgi:hypothetical protein
MYVQYCPLANDAGGLGGQGNYSCYPQKSDGEWNKDGEGKKEKDDIFCILLRLQEIRPWDRRYGQPRSSVPVTVVDQESDEDAVEQQ